MSLGPKALKRPREEVSEGLRGTSSGEAEAIEMVYLYKEKAEGVPRVFL